MRKPSPRVEYRKDRKWWGVLEYKNGNRHWISSGFTSEQEAQGSLAELIIERQRGTTQDPTVGEILAIYLEEHIPHTIGQQSAGSVHNTLSPFWASLKVSQVNKNLCQKYIKARNAQREEKKKKKLSNATIRKELEHLSAAINYCRENKNLKHDPIIWKPMPPAPRQRWLSGIEAAKLLKASKDHTRLFILIGLYTGARSGAILALQWQDVDFRNEIIDFRSSQKSATKGYTVSAMPARLKRELLKAKLDIGPVINIKGIPLGSIKKAFKTCCDRAGIQGVTPHTLRHTFASWRIQKGVPASDVAEALGHSTSLMVERTYGHMGNTHLERIRKSFATVPAAVPKRQIEEEKKAVSH